MRDKVANVVALSIGVRADRMTRTVACKAWPPWQAKKTMRRRAATPGHGVPLRDVPPGILGRREAYMLWDHLAGELG
jgi:hypothetical protein